MATQNSEKVVLITGCSTGIGFSLALLLAKDADCRFRVYATMRNLGKKETLEKAAGAFLNKTLFIKQLDVSVDEQITRTVDEIIGEVGKIDILVNNAGFGLFGAFETQSIAKIRSMFATNVYGPIYLTQKLLPLWKKNKSGHVIMVTSVEGVIGFPFNSTYCASKAALEGFSESLAAECLDFNIRVSIIEPGPVMTKFVENVKENMKLDEQDLTNLDEETKKLMQTVADNTSNSFATMSQTPEDVAQQILKAILGNEQQLRYLTNQMYSAAIQKKLTDPTGNDVLRLTKIIKK